MILKQKLIDRNTNSLIGEDTVIYWRKANQIHRFFVENVQNGKDDCEEYNVSKKILKKLYKYCKHDFKYLKNSLTKEERKETKTHPRYWTSEKLNNYTLFDNINKDELKLKLTPGFFFGNSQTIDYWHYVTLKRTIKTLKPILKRSKYNNLKTEYYYTSSW